MGKLIQRPCYANGPLKPYNSTVPQSMNNIEMFIIHVVDHDLCYNDEFAQLAFLILYSHIQEPLSHMMNFWILKDLLLTSKKCYIVIAITYKRIRISVTGLKITESFLDTTSNKTTTKNVGLIFFLSHSHTHYT